jgi:Bacterial antitoxin of type II TA system, VapB
MRTTLDIDDRLLDALMARSPGLSKTKAIERAIDQYVKTDAYERVRGLRGAYPDMADHTAELDRLDLERQDQLERRRSGRA